MFGIDDVLSGIGANRQIQAMKEAIDFAKEVDARTYRDLAPYRKFGGTQLNALSDYLTNKNPANFLDPGYNFRLTQGTNNLMNNAAAGGMVQSGDTLRALTQYGQDMASQEYNNAFNRWLSEGGFRQNLAGMGQNAATQSGYIGNQAAGTAGNLTAQTNFGAPWQIGANAIGSMGGAALNLYGVNQLANALRGPGGSNTSQWSQPPGFYGPMP